MFKFSLQMVTEKEKKSGTVLYAVHKGWTPGVYRTWMDAQQAVDGFSGAVYRRFLDEVRAEAFVKYGNCGPPVDERVGVAVPGPVAARSKTGETLEETENTLIVFTDGSCLRQGTPQASAGIGVVFPFHHRQLSEPLRERPTNNRAELVAILRSFTIADEIDPSRRKTLVIYTDSEYSLKTMTRWIKSWKVKGWKRSNGEPVLNVDILEKIDQAMHKRRIEMVHVRAHTGKQDPIHRWNDVADRLAQDAAGV